MLGLVLALAVADPHAGHIPLAMKSDPEHAEMLVIPQDWRVKPFQCRAPCTVWVPPRLSFQVYAVEHGYRMVPDQAPVQWVHVKGGWDLSAHEVTIRMVPHQDPPNP